MLYGVWHISHTWRVEVGASLMYGRLIGRFGPTPPLLLSRAILSLFGRESTHRCRQCVCTYATEPVHAQGEISLAEGERQLQMRHEASLGGLLSEWADLGRDRFFDGLAAGFEDCGGPSGDVSVCDGDDGVEGAFGDNARGSGG